MSQNSLMSWIVHYICGNSKMIQNLSNVEKAISDAEHKVTSLATKVAILEGRIDPLRFFIEALEGAHRHQEDRG